MNNQTDEAREDTWRLRLWGLIVATGTALYLSKLSLLLCVMSLLVLCMLLSLLLSIYFCLFVSWLPVSGEIKMHILAYSFYTARTACQQAQLPKTISEISTLKDFGELTVTSLIMLQLVIICALVILSEAGRLLVSFCLCVCMSVCLSGQELRNHSSEVAITWQEHVLHGVS